ncbi:MAG: AAA family ATPase [Proteobacteria bacterium]|nr:AAA family ATPase [Pseudomonadota bacterium]
MKILAIRGKNLASLAGEFDIDLQHGVLARAGLFAITGRTGAGKSTLLDAMCLALFGRTPRLSGRSRVKLGGDGPDADLRDGDPRVLLRRGTGEGYAEVDFEGRNGTAWRARWTVRRARVDPSQRLQAAQMSLQLLADGRSFGDTKTDVLSRIEAELGLTFDQFTRSVLLAQGEFAAFLKASGKDRASLLEKMTGTALYAELSSRCHERRREEELKLDTLRQSSRDLQLLTSLERAALSDAASASDVLRRRLQSELEAYQALAAWHELVEGERAALKISEGQVEAAQVAWDLRAPRLKQVQALIEVAPIEAQRAETETERQSANAAREAISGREQGALAAHAHAQAAEVETKAQLASATQAKADAQPSIDAARVLDGQLRAHSAAHSQKQVDLEAQQALLAETLGNAERLVAEAKSDRAEASALESWLSAHPTATRMAAERTQFAGAIRILLRSGASCTSTAEQLSEAAQGLESLRQSVSVLNEDAKVGKRAHQRAQATVEALQVAGADEASTVRRERKLRELEQTRDDAHKLTTEVIELQQAQGRAEDTQRRAETQHRDGTARRQQITQALPVATAQRDEAKHAYDRAKATESLAAQRYLLVEGEPCPLCGSADHPAVGEPFASLLHDAHTRYAEHDARLQALQSELSSLEASLPAVQSAATEAVERVATTSAALRSKQTHLDAQIRRLGEPLTAALDERIEVEKAELQTLAASWQAALEARQVLHASALGFDEKLRIERAALDTAEARHAAVVDAHERAQSAFEEARQDLETLFGDKPGWQALAPGHATEFVQPWLEQRQSAEDKSAALAEAHKRLAARVESITAIESKRDQQQAELGRLHAQHDKSAQRLNALRAERASALAHADVDQAAAELQGLVDAANVAATEQSKALASTAETVSQISQERAAAQAHLEAAQTAADQAAEKAHGAVLKAGLDPNGYRAQLLPGLAALHAEQALLSAEKIALDATRARRDTLRERLTSLEAAAPAVPDEAGPLDAEACRKQVVDIAANLETATQSWGHHRGRLEADDLARRQHQQVEVRLQAQAAVTQRWISLNDLIGSADGSKLRKFAQSLTLDSLLAHANAHLSELAPRYHLQRVPSEDLEIQVLDTEMGDDVRPVTSLSGGESFLVSLALALGLSSLAARDVRIDSLFIDEGFGTLDHQTLQLVLDTLDTLQATGRKVGIISHVSGIAERVGYRIDVRTRGQGRSTVRTQGGI